MTGIKMFIMVAVFLLLLAIFLFVCNSDETAVKNWILDNREQIRSIEYKAFSLGPYWYFKHLRVYRVETTNNHVYWFRFGQLLDSPEVYIEIGNEYKELNYEQHL